MLGYIYVNVSQRGYIKSYNKIRCHIPRRWLNLEESIGSKVVRSCDGCNPTLHTGMGTPNYRAFRSSSSSSYVLKYLEGILKAGKTRSAWDIKGRKGLSAIRASTR